MDGKQNCKFSMANSLSEMLQSICNVSEQRANELLEAANGSVERAVDIYFHQKQVEQTSLKSPGTSQRKKRLQPEESLSEVKDSPSTKQARIHSFFQKGPTNESKTLESESKNKSPETISIDSKVTPKVNFQVSFGRLAQTLQEMADTTKRLIKLAVLSNFIQDFVRHADESNKVYGLTCALNLILGRCGTDKPLDVSHSAVSKAMQVILGTSRSQLSAANRQFGDLGDTAASFFQKKTYFWSTSTPSSLSIIELFNLLQQIVLTDGRDGKQDILFRLMRSCQSKSELRFLVRLLIGNMRVGANLKTVLASLAMAICSIRKEDGDESDTKAAIELVQKTHDICPDLEKIIGSLLKGGLSRMKKECGIQLLTPIAPMLAHPVHDLGQVETAMKDTGDHIVLEWKYDGVRCQAHHNGTSTKLFSRHMLESTLQYPDAVKAIMKAKTDKVTSFIIDSEIVGVELDGDQVHLLPFQELSKRKKKNDDGSGVRIKIFVFDLMFLNGISYIDRPLWERQEVLREHFQETTDFSFVSSRTISIYDRKTVEQFLEEAVKSGTEGLMVKMLGKSESSEGDKALATASTYEAGTRSHSWLKVKRDYVAGYADTIDVVPIGAWYGSGRKAQKSFLSPILLAVYDEEEDVYRSISRCMTFTDAMYEAMREFYFHGTAYPEELEISNGKDDAKTEAVASKTDAVATINDDGDDYDVEITKTTETQERINCFPSRPSSAFVITNESPPIWFKPLEVFEVSFADMTLSRQHTAAAGLVDDPEGRGVALRFPRFKRRRPDKRPEQATTTVQICQLFANQSKQGSGNRSK